MRRKNLRMKIMIIKPIKITFPDHGRYSKGEDGQWYFHHPGRHTYHAGKALCRSEGASLLIVESQRKQTMINRVYGHTTVWLALYDTLGANIITYYKWMLPDGTVS